MLHCRADSVRAASAVKGKGWICWPVLSAWLETQFGESGDFDLALRGLLGEEAALSANTVARLKEKWQGEWAGWQSRPLEELEVVYLWADGIYVKAGLEKEKAVLLVVLAALSDGSKVVVSVTSGYRESTESWSLRDLKRRGMNAPRLVIADGHLGIWGALCNVYPEAEGSVAGITASSISWPRCPNASSPRPY